MLPNAATAEPFLPSADDVLGCGIPLRELAPSLVEQIIDKREPFPCVADPAALGHATPSEFQWACEVCVTCPLSPLFAMSFDRETYDT